MRGAALRRREFLASASGLVLASCATSPPSDDAFVVPAIQVLERAARLLYPHEKLDDAVYAEAIDGVVADAFPDLDAMRVLGDGADALDAAGPGRFIDRSEAEQIAALRSMEGTPFFTTLRAGVQTHLYARPAVWSMLGYPGPALPFGGYLDKGFDDIDWLPA